MYRVMNLQMSLFGSFSEIRPNTGIFIDLLTALKDEQFIPSSTDFTNIDIPTGKISVDSRMQMISPDKTWSIVFLSDRIDINYTYQIGTQIYEITDDLLAKGRTILSKISDVFPSLIGNRIAVNCRFDIENIVDADMIKLYSRLLNPLSMCPKESLSEWTMRLNSRTTLNISDINSEECNRCIEISQVENLNTSAQTSELQHSIFIIIDVNTLSYNTSPRFSWNDLIYFTDEADKFIHNVVDDIGVF